MDAAPGGVIQADPATNSLVITVLFFFFQAEDGIRDDLVTGVQTCALPIWGGEFRAEFVPAHGEIVASEHWCSSGFSNTDLDLQLTRHGIQRLIVIGLIAHTCIEATVRFAAELGYDVTVVSDAVADYSDDMMRAALEINMPNYASAIVTTQDIVEALSAMRTTISTT